FYSMPEGAGALLVCAGKDGKPPEAFVRDAAASLSLMKDPQGWGCPHAVQQGDKVVVRWPGAGAFRRCGQCAQGHTLLGIAEHIGAPDALALFTVEVELASLQGGEGLPQPALDAAALERYKKGELDDQGLLDAQRAARVAGLKELGKPLLVNDRVVHASAASFIASLRPTPLEEKALAAALDGYARPVVVERGTPAKVLAELWPERGVAALTAAGGSEEVARDIHAKHDVGAKGVGSALQQAQQRGARAATDAALPTYADLPPAAWFADRVARAHHAHGKQAALQALGQTAPGVPAGVVHAFERALGHGGQQWKYTPLDLDVATQLEPHAARLIAARPEQYHAALQALARAAGVSEELREG
ncbi:MAG: hypothetical protein LC624_04355, partial [Halobacteriales archaeon]|nr:hypothetical protein [Halobacteriales archaeon]